MAISYFLSDLHITDNQDDRYLKLNNFLEIEWAKDPGDIFLLGDIFDLWVADHLVFVKHYDQLIQNLLGIKKKGYRIIYFEGNHDLHLTQFWQNQLGFEVEKGVQNYTIDSLKFRLEHGDLINQEDLQYLRLRAFLRNPCMTYLAHQIPGSFWNFLGKRWSHQSRKKSHQFRSQRNQDIVQMIRQHAEKKIKEDYFDVIITGHMHVEDLFEFEFSGKKITSINLGSWFEKTQILKFKFLSANDPKKNFEWISLSS